MPYHRALDRTRITDALLFEGTLPSHGLVFFFPVFPFITPVLVI